MRWSRCRTHSSLAAMHYLAERLGRRVGGSSGTNLDWRIAAAQQMKAAVESGSIVAILCDGGELCHHLLRPGVAAGAGI